MEAISPYFPLPADTIFFFSKGNSDPRYKDLSNFGDAPFWAPGPFDDNLLLFASSEHYFIAHKTLNHADFEWIRTAPRPGIAKRRGSFNGENGRRITLRDNWNNYHRYHVMLRALHYKFALPRYHELLLSTGHRYLAEDSPTDFEWGCRDSNGGYTGKNLLGRALMRVRQEIT